MVIFAFYKNNTSGNMEDGEEGVREEALTLVHK